ncbi:MAG TPA: ester cyclase [Acidimicrobiia bacterium]|nr:ester cyclase [Acidimicrobiia bacterium]
MTRANELTMPFVEMTAAQFQAHLDTRSVNTHDPDAVAAWFADDAVQRRVATGEVAKGREEIRAAVAETFGVLPDLRIEVHDAFATGNRMCVQGVLTGTHRGEWMGIPPTDRAIEVETCLVFRFNEDGLVAEETIYGDSATVLSQLGLLAGA